MITEKGVKQITIRGSITLLILRVLFTELIFEFSYIIWRFLIDLNLFEVSNETQLVINSFSVILFLVLVTVIQTAIIIYIILDWANRYYEFNSDEIVFKSGVASKQERSYPYRDIQSVRLKQGILGRLLNFGTIEVFIPTLGYDLHFTEIPNPREFVKIIKDKAPGETKGERFLFKRS
jgi:uncharacterized membrane protein YdbT with pleckstrin-like domain